MFFWVFNDLRCEDINDLRCEDIVCFVDIGWIVDRHCLDFLLVIPIDQIINLA